MKLDMDIKREITDLDLDSPIIAEKKPISRFVILSVLAHVVVGSAILASNYAHQSEEPKEVVEIQMTDAAPVATSPEQAPVAEEAAEAPTPVVAEQALVPAPVPTPKPVIAAAIAKPATPSNTPAPKATIDDIKTPTLDETPVIEAKESKLNPDDLNEDLNQVDEEHDQKIIAAKSQIEDEVSEVEKSLSESTQKAEEKIKKEQEEQRIAAEEAAAAEAARIAAEKAKQAEGEKNAGPGAIATEVRSLESLRQMPGNPKPLYDQTERLRGDKGVVVFQAFVTQEGKLADFKLLQSTGHRNLDAKTLKALKQWKFYPGQEGWVELPFDWNLKGGAQEMPALLRRKAALKNNEQP